MTKYSILIHAESVEEMDEATLAEFNKKLAGIKALVEQDGSGTFVAMVTPLQAEKIAEGRPL